MSLIGGGHNFVLVFVLNALQSYNNSNIIDVLRRKYVLGPSQCSF